MEDVLNMKYLDLEHGPETTIANSDIFNHRFSQMMDFNFTYLKDEIDDYDLFYLVESEVQSNLNYKKNYIQFVLPSNQAQHIDLFETLHFDVHDSAVLKKTGNRFDIEAKDLQVSLLNEADGPLWIQFALSYLEIEDSLLLKQTEDLLNVYLKQKPYAIHVIKENQQIIASLIIIQKPNMNQVSYFFGEDASLKLQILAAVVSELKNLHMIADLDEDEFSDYEKLGFSIVEQVTVCSKYL